MRAIDYYIDVLEKKRRIIAQRCKGFHKLLQVWLNDKISETICKGTDHEKWKYGIGYMVTFSGKFCIHPESVIKVINKTIQLETNQL